jgi:hypothetical protein
MQNSTGKAWAAHLPSKASGPKEAGQADGRMLARGRFDPFTTPSGNDRICALRSCTASSSHEQQSSSGHRRKARDGFFLPFASTSGPRRAACPVLSRQRWRASIRWVPMAHDDLVCPPSVSACGHPARRLAVYAFHAKLSRRRRSACGAWSGYLLRNGATMGIEVRAVVRPRTSAWTPAANLSVASR